MQRSCDYVVVKLSPDPARDEAINAAVAILHPDRLQIRMTPNPERLRFIAPGSPPTMLKDLETSLQALDAPDLKTPERIERIRHLPGLFISAPGTLYFQNEDELNEHIDGLVSRLLSAVRMPASLPTTKTTTLTRELVKVFRQEKLLGADAKALDDHKIVRDFPISSDGALRADFVAKNRLAHVTETVDLRGAGDVSIAKMKDIAVAAVTLDEARRTFGPRTRRYFVYAASAAAERQARGFLQAAEHHSDHLFNYSSKLDQAAYLDFIYSALRGDSRSSRSPSRAQVCSRADWGRSEPEPR